MILREAMVLLAAGVVAGILLASTVPWPVLMLFAVTRAFGIAVGGWPWHSRNHPGATCRQDGSDDGTAG